MSDVEPPKPAEPHRASDSQSIVLAAVMPYWLSTRQVGAKAGMLEAVVTPVLKKLCAEGSIETPRGTYLGVFWRQRRERDRQGPR